MAGTMLGRCAPGAMSDGPPGASVDFGISARSGGSGCRGPEIIWPGFGAGGEGRDGITGPLLSGLPGVGEGWPLASGGRSGDAGRTSECGTAGADSLWDSSALGAGSLFASELAAGRAVSGAGSGGCGRASRTGSCWIVCSRSSPAGAEDSPNAPAATRWRICSATSSSSELECVFFSVTPSSGNRSRMMFGLTSSSRASSLMRILLILETPRLTPPGI